MADQVAFYIPLVYLACTFGGSSATGPAPSASLIRDRDANFTSIFDAIGREDGHDPAADSEGETTSCLLH
jgi:hypothetical protein